MKKVVWGILGTAKIGMLKVIPAMKRSQWIEVRAIASRSEAAARQAARELHIPKAYGSYEALLSDPEIEAVYNPLPNHVHVILTLRAAASGKHVLCEKPIALTSEEAEQLRSVAGKTHIIEAFMVRFHPQWHRARELVHSGRIINAPQGHPTRIFIDDGSTHDGESMATETVARAINTCSRARRSRGQCGVTSAYRSE